MEMINKLKCQLFGHKYKVEIWYDANVQKIKCERCFEKFGINHNIKALTKWDEDLEECMKIAYPEKYKLKTETNGKND